MVAQSNRRRTYTVDEWRELQRTNHDTKYEYIDGYVYAMSGGTLDHAGIAVNVVSALNAAFSDGTCFAYNSDAAVRLSDQRYTLPDVTVTCDERDHGRSTEVRSPRVVIEVLSESTEAYDRGQKAGLYRASPFIQEYVLIATRYQAIEVYRRIAPGWMLQEYGPGAHVRLVSIGVDLPVETIYRRTQVPSTSTPDAQEV